MSCEIDGRSFEVVQPQSVAELSEFVRDAVANAQAVYPVGGRTMLELGNPPARDGIALDTTRLDRVIDYPSRDMTITVEAGIRMAALQELLRANGQRLPVDVPRGAEATLGGAVATNTSGPRRYAYGTLRDYVIGISVVDAAGVETKAGGRVVKNVAGYDLCKLYTGSLGTLGIITQLTLKLLPIPETSAVAWLEVKNSAQLPETLDRLGKTQTRPTAIELLNVNGKQVLAQHAAADGHNTAPAIALGFEANDEAVRWQLDRVRDEIRGLDVAMESATGDAAGRAWSGLIEFPSLSNITFKANLRSSAVSEYLDGVGREPVPWALRVHAANGVAHGITAQPTDNMDRFARDARESLTRLRSLALQRHGNLVMLRCPTAWKSQIPVWGEPRADGWLMQAIKRKLDPHNVLNPGRFLGEVNGT